MYEKCLSMHKRKPEKENLQIGIVVKSTGKWYIVQFDDGETKQCTLAGRIRMDGSRSTNPVAVGDNVKVKINDNDEYGVIASIEPRKNGIIRKATRLSSASHVLASNIDQAFLVLTLKQPRTSAGFIDRFLVSASAFDIPVIILINKIDLLDEEELWEASKIEKLYQKIGIPVHQISVLKNIGLTIVKDLMKDKVSMISGHSGTGKSALIMALEPHLNIRIGEISSTHNKGQHTTTFAEMHRLSFGGYIADTPGVKEFGLSNFQMEEVAHHFPEMMDLLEKCQYYNCTHTHEPGCKVKQAVEEGDIAFSRYQSYLSIVNDNNLEQTDWS